MKPIKTDYANLNFTKEGCFDLPGTRYTYEDGIENYSGEILYNDLVIRICPSAKANGS